MTTSLMLWQHTHQPSTLCGSRSCCQGWTYHLSMELWKIIIQILTLNPRRGPLWSGTCGSAKVRKV
jgi:hypothetical protein